MRNAISVEQIVASMILFLATNTDYRIIGHLFGVSISTVSVVTKEVCVCVLPPTKRYSQSTLGAYGLISCRAV